MAKQIAVILGSINHDNSKKLLTGLMAAAKETDTNLYIFTNYIGARESEASVLNSYRIIELPDFHKFDGLIMSMNALSIHSVADYVLNQIKETNIPTVSIDREFEGMSCVKISSYDAEFKMVEHMILTHGYREIHYVAGPLEHPEAAARYQAYKDALAKYNIPFREENVYCGRFTILSGNNAADYFLKDGKCPRCIICGNDAMASGVIEVLEKKGYSVPDDVCIAGFDNSDFSELTFPPLTTIDKSQFEVGKKCVYEILALTEGSKPRTQIVPCKLQNRGSCGCNRHKHVDVKHLRQKYMQHQSITGRMADIVRNMMAELSIQNNIESVIDTIKNYIPQSDLGDFYLCLCEKDKIFHIPEKNIGRNIDIMPANSTLTDKIYIPLAYEDGKFSSYPYFDRGMVLPEDCRNRGSGNVYVITPCFFENSYFGYSVCTNAENVSENIQYYSWMMNIGIALESTRNRMLLEDAIHKLNNMWSYDMLTNLYNRAGFFYEAKTMLDNMKRKNENAFIMFFDLDGLKTINDTKGHEVGDQLIQAMADCIRYNLTYNTIAMRYGGDEFVIFGSFKEPEEVEAIYHGIRHSIQALNDSGRYDFTLSTSIGGSGYKATDIADLSVLIDLADQNMYKEKRKKKALKNRPNNTN